MKYMLTGSALLAAATATCTNSGGNSYCNEVDAITYTGVGGSGTYNKINFMDPESGECSSTSYAYSGSLAPLDEEVSMHFRGPLQLKQFAFYTPGSDTSKKDKAKAKRSEHVRRHAHGHAHAHKARAPALGDEVIATIDGQVVSWANNWSGEPTSAAAAPVSTPTTQSNNVVGAVADVVNNVVDTVTGSGSTSASGSGWARQAYYNSAAQIMDGLVFLNHLGGSGSGTFDYNFGNSLSFSGADGVSAATKNTILSDITIPSSGEVVIMSDKQCTDSDPCDYSRPSTVAYHGFDGPAKAFFYEFQMPDDGQTGNTEYEAVNMPAIWMLNAEIPRTLQYGNAACSCWTSGCGEFDIFEVLSAGETRAKSTLHGNIAGGDSDYFKRPVDQAIFAAVVLYNDNIHIKVFPSDMTLDSTMPIDIINEVISSTSVASELVSLFNLAGAAGDSSA